MAVKSEQIEKNLVKLTFEVSAEDFEKAVQQAYLKNKNKINVKGFRKGKAPRAVIEKEYGVGVFYDEAINAVLPEAYEAAAKESGADIVARPEIDVEDIKKGENVVFTALVTTRPDVKLGEYKGIEIEKIEHNVTDEDVQKELENAQKQNARLITVEDRAVENGDITTIDFEGFVDGVAFEGGKGTDYQLEIGSNTFIPGFEDAMVGMQIGVEGDVNVTFPEEYHAENLAGKPAVFKVTVKGIQKRELPELNDDFASEVSEFEPLEEYKNDIKAKLEKNAENQTKAETEEAVISKVVENVEVDIPEAMIDARVDMLIRDYAQRLAYQGMNLDMYLKYSGVTMDQLKMQFKGQAAKQVKGSLVLEAIVNAENITVGDEEYDMHIVDMAKQYNTETETLTEMISDSEKESIMKELAVEKAVQLIVNNAVIK